MHYSCSLSLVARYEKSLAFKSTNFLCKVFIDYGTRVVMQALSILEWRTNGPADIDFQQCENVIQDRLSRDYIEFNYVTCLCCVSEVSMSSEAEQYLHDAAKLIASYYYLRSLESRIQSVESQIITQLTTILFMVPVQPAYEFMYDMDLHATCLCNNVNCLRCGSLWSTQSPLQFSNPYPIAIYDVFGKRTIVHICDIICSRCGIGRQQWSGELQGIYKFIIISRNMFHYFYELLS